MMMLMLRYLLTIFLKTRLQDALKLRQQRLRPLNQILVMTDTATHKTKNLKNIMLKLEPKCKSNFVYNFSETKYRTISKNCIFYLCFASLEMSDYAGCLKYGTELLRKNLT
jgi:hypothetical protein